MSKNIEINIQTTANTYETLYPKTLGSLIDGAVSLATNATNATSATSASQATKLSTARTIRTNLSSTSTASFDGTSNIIPGITGILSVSYGGTGVTSYSSLANQLSPYISTGAKLTSGTFNGTGSSVTVYCGFQPKFVAANGFNDSGYTANNVKVYVGSFFATPTIGWAFMSDNRDTSYANSGTSLYRRIDVNMTSTGFTISSIYAGGWFFNNTSNCNYIAIG